jgi:ABC-type branched-subunit amino acid transport system substrate-binding protein
MSAVLGLSYPGVAAAVDAEPSVCSMNAALFMPLSGGAATVGDDFRRAALMSYEKLSPEIQQRLKLIFEDTQLNAAVALSAYRSVTQRERVDVAVVSFAESVNAIAPIAEREKVPFIGCAPTRQFLRDRPFTFRHWTDPESMAPLLLSEIQRQGRGDLALVYLDHPAMTEYGIYFERYARERGVQFSMVSSVLPSDADFRALATKIVVKKPSGVVYFLLPPQTSQFTKQYRSIDKSTPMFSFINTESEGEVRAAAGAMEGVVYVGPKFSDEFIQEFKRRHQGGFPEICSGNFYDIVQMLAEALRVGACSGDKLREFLANLRSFRGVAGEYGVSAEREFKLNLELRTVRDGTFTRYEPTTNGN